MEQITRKPGLGRRIRGRAGALARRARLLASIRHLHGPRRPDAGPEEVTVIALVRDGGFYLDGFFDHYRSLGARHFVFFDNGSTDGTIDRIRSEPGTVIVRSTLPWTMFENDFRRYAAETYCRGRWCLFADMDEIFDFEGSAQIGLPGLVRYLSDHRFTALIAQMLEMFPDRPIRDTARLPYDQALRTYRYCDLSSLVAVPYHDDSGAIDFAFWLKDNTVADDRIGFLFGGVRRKLFGEMCCLTKHPLVFVGPGVIPAVHPHCSAHVACADFSALIRHYKFTNDPLSRDARSVEAAAAGHGEDRRRLQVLQTDPDLTLHSPDAIRFQGIAQMYDRGFLVRSPRFSDYVARGGDPAV